MNVAVAGCIHGQLNLLYRTLQDLEEKQGLTCDLLLCCGDFQAVRCRADLDYLKCPEKYKKIGDFQDYYNGTRKAPVLTLFIGGNHEAMAYMRELHFGGWVAPNIYYLGNSNVVDIQKGEAKLTLGGASGIFNLRSFYEQVLLQPVPFRGGGHISAYHTKQHDIFKLMLYSKAGGEKIDAMMSHDWPAGIQHYGDISQLLKVKPFLKNDIAKRQLGSSALAALLEQLQPQLWFAAHMHVKYEAKVRTPKSQTRFLALDKCLVGRKFIQILKIPKTRCDSPVTLTYNKTWLGVSRASMTMMRETSKLFQWSKGRLQLSEAGRGKLEDCSKLVRLQKGECEIPRSILFEWEPELFKLNEQTEQFLTLAGEEDLGPWEGSVFAGRGEKGSEELVL